MKILNEKIIKIITKIAALGGVDDVSLYQASQATNDVFITQNMEVYFINVGQGDTTFIELGDGTYILIDAGLENQGFPQNTVAPDNNVTTQIPQQTKVYVTLNGKSYHLSKNCTALKRSTTIIELTKDETIK